MPRFKDQAICIRDLDWSETSQVIVLLTESHGKLRGLAKGSKRQSPSSVQRFSGGIELLTAGQVIATTRPTSDLAAVTEWDLQQDYFALRRDLKKQRLAMYAADLCNAMLADSDAHPRAFGLLRGLLDGLCAVGEASNLDSQAGPPLTREGRGEGGASEPGPVPSRGDRGAAAPSPQPSPSRERGQDSADAAALLRFQWGLLEDCGYKPELYEDVRQGGALGSAKAYSFDPVAGGVTAQDGIADWRVRAATVQLLRAVAEGEAVEADAAAIGRANKLLCVYYRAILDKELPTMPIVLGA